MPEHLWIANNAGRGCARCDPLQAVADADDAEADLDTDAVEKAQAALAALPHQTTYNPVNLPSNAFHHVHYPHPSVHVPCGISQCVPTVHRSSVSLVHSCGAFARLVPFVRGLQHIHHDR